MTMGACRLLGDLRSALRLVSKSLLFMGVVTVTWSQTPSGLYKAIGAVVSVESPGFTLQTDAGARLTIEVPGTALLVRVAPGEKTLKGATKISEKAFEVIR